MGFYANEDDRYGIIYKITNVKNNKCYIGQTTYNFNMRYKHPGKGIERVYNHYKYNKNNNRSYNVHLLRSIEKYGLDSFIVDEEFDIAYSKEELDELEKKYIKEFDCINNGYNNKEGGSDGKYSEEAKIRISEGRSTPVWCFELNKMFLSTRLAAEELGISSCDRISDVCRRFGEKTCSIKGYHFVYYEDYLSMTEKERGEYVYNIEERKRKGKEKVALLNKGKTLPNEHKEKISNALKGKVVSQETRDKISQAKKGKYVGENSTTGKEVYVYDTNGKYINKFCTCKECAKWFLHEGYAKSFAKDPISVVGAKISWSARNRKMYNGFVLSYEHINFTDKEFSSSKKY